MAGGNINQQKAGYDYGFNLGLAFQIVDDLMDYSIKSELMGKNTGDDFKLGKTTLPIILAWEKSTEAEKKFWNKTLKMGEQVEKDFDYAVKILEKYNIFYECEMMATDFIKICQKSLDKFPDTKFKKPLIELANQSLKRKK